jgi:hypothetical protein
MPKDVVNDFRVTVLGQRIAKASLPAETVVDGERHVVTAHRAGLASATLVLKTAGF